MTIQPINARRIALALVMARLDRDDAMVAELLANLDRLDLREVAVSLAEYTIDIVAPDERDEFRAECAQEALWIATGEP